MTTIGKAALGMALAALSAAGYGTVRCRAGRGPTTR